MTTTVAACDVGKGKSDVVYSPTTADAAVINTVIPNGSIGVLVDDAPAYKQSTTIYTKLRHFRDKIQELDTTFIAAATNGLAIAADPNDPKYDTVNVAVNPTTDTLATALQSKTLALVISGPFGGTELAYSAAIRCIDTLLERYFDAP